MKLLLSSTIILFCLIFFSCTEKKSETEYIPITKFDPLRNPGTDLEAAIKEAKSSNKRILLDVGGDWCIWCNRLDEFFEKNKDVNEFMNRNFVVVKVNYSEENKNEKFLLQFPEIPGYPHYFVLDDNGKLLHSQDTGKLEEGKGHDRNKVFKFLKEWAPK